MHTTTDEERRAYERWQEMSSTERHLLLWRLWRNPDSPLNSTSRLWREGLLFGTGVAVSALLGFFFIVSVFYLSLDTMLGTLAVITGAMGGYFWSRLQHTLHNVHLIYLVTLYRWSNENDIKKTQHQLQKQMHQRSSSNKKPRSRL